MRTLLCSLIISLLLFPLLTLAQQEATLPNGKKVLLNKDGTWTYVTEPKDAPKTGKTACSDLIETTADKVTGRSYTAAKAPLIVSNDAGKTGFRIITMLGSGSVVLSFTAVERGSGCIDDDSAINILFRDGTRLALSNNGKFNCDGDATVYFGGIFGNQSALEQLKTKQVETIRVSTMKSFVERDFSPAQSQQLMQELSCLHESRK